jgi:regulator of replication initiation timing
MTKLLNGAAEKIVDQFISPLVAENTRLKVENDDLKKEIKRLWTMMSVWTAELDARDKAGSREKKS